GAGIDCVANLTTRSLRVGKETNSMLSFRARMSDEEVLPPWALAEWFPGVECKLSDHSLARARHETRRIHQSIDGVRERKVDGFPGGLLREECRENLISP